MAIIIRKAEAHDCSQMMGLINELALFERAPAEVTVEMLHFKQSGFGQNPVWWAFVAEAEENGPIIGMALYYIRYSTWKGQRMYLEDLVVGEQWRGKGIGKQLFERLIQEAKQKEFAGMVWQALDWNQPALDFYKKYDATFDPGWVNCSLDF